MSNDEVIDYFEPAQPLKTKSQVLRLIEKSKIDLEAKPNDTSNGCFNVNGAPFGSLGNFTLLTGKAKSKKTFLVSLIAAAACIKDRNNMKISANFPQGKEDVIYIDTEQSEEHVWHVATRILLLTGQNKLSNLHVYCLRAYSPETRRIAISQIMQLHPHAALVVIDGARDLVSSINDEYEASKVANGLQKISYQLNCHIITVLHENKSNKDARGHLGTELLNKAETVLSVKKKSDLVSSASVTFSRKKPIPPFSFKINENGLPELIDQELYGSTQELNTTNEWSPDDLSEEKLKAVLKEVSKLSNNKSEYSYSDLVSYLQDASEKEIFSIGTNRTKELLKQLLKRNLIKKHGKERSPNAYYTLEH